MNTQTLKVERIKFRNGNRFAEAIAAQDACNPIALVNLLREIVRDCQDDTNYSGTNYINRDPAYCIMLQKLGDMSGIDNMPFSDEAETGRKGYSSLYEACAALGNEPDFDRTKLAWFR